MAGSGMSVGGRILGHEQNYLGDTKNILLLVGYQSPGTIGHKLQNGAKKIFIEGKNLEVHAQILTIEGYSAHMDSDHLLEYVSEIGPSLKKVFVTMGELGASMFLAQRVRDYLGVEAVVPEKGSRYSF